LILSLGTVAPVTSAVATIVTALLASTAGVLTIYDAIQKRLHRISLEKKQYRVQIYKLNKQEAAELRALADELSKSLGFKKFDDLFVRTGENEEVAAKILSAQFWRLRLIAQYTKNGQLYMPPTHIPES
jgi:hypothetical protein